MTGRWNHSLVPWDYLGFSSCSTQRNIDRRYCTHFRAFLKRNQKGYNMDCSWFCNIFLVTGTGMGMVGVGDLFLRLQQRCRDKNSFHSASILLLAALQAYGLSTAPCVLSVSCFFALHLRLEGWGSCMAAARDKHGERWQPLLAHPLTLLPPFISPQTAVPPLNWSKYQIPDEDEHTVSCWTGVLPQELQKQSYQH